MPNHNLSVASLCTSVLLAGCGTKPHSVFLRSISLYRCADDTSIKLHYHASNVRSGARSVYLRMKETLLIWIIVLDDAFSISQVICFLHQYFQDIQLHYVPLTAYVEQGLMGSCLLSLTNFYRRHVQAKVLRSRRDHYAQPRG